MRKYCLMGLSILVQAILLQNVWADNVDAIFQSVDIQDARYVIVEGSGGARVKLNLVNQSPAELSLLGMRDEHGSSWYIQAKVSDRKYVKLSSIVLAPEENLNFSTNHLQIKSQDVLGQNLKPNIKLLLLLNTGEVPFQAHVISDIN